MACTCGIGRSVLVNGGYDAAAPGVDLAVRTCVATTLALLFVTACQPLGAIGACNTQIDWVDFIEVGSTTYLAGHDPEIAIPDGDLGPVYSTVKHKVSGNVCDPGYRLKDGDAAFLEIGTPIHRVSGYPPSQRLAVRTSGRTVVYVARPSG